MYIVPVNRTGHKYRAKLLALQSVLQDAQISGEQAAETVELDQTRVGRLSRMDAMQAQAMSIETNTRRKAELRRVAAALQRIADDEFGDCLQCGESIAPGRLEIDPAATLCIECAESNEALE
jgi:DnaK suppressor protein